jgi:predicted PurR-regulated permease PerM
LEGAKISKYIFFALLIILLYLTFRLAQPFITYLFVGIVLTVATYPLYAWLAKRLKNKKLSSLIVILLILLIIIIPCIIIISALLKQTIGFINTFDPHYFEKINTYLVKGLGPRADLSNNFDQLITNIKDFILKATFSIAGSVTDISIGLFLMFFVIYYCFVEGDAWMANIEDLIPFNKKRKEKLVRKIQEVTRGVIYGQVFIAILEGILGGIGFFTAGISNPVFWGFIITILAFLPFLGANYVLLPASIIEISKGNVLIGILLLIYGFCIVIGIENILRPHIISGKGRIHPLIALIGIIGGLKLFGLLGVIIGPLIAALFMTMAEFFYEDYVKVNEKTNN